MMPGHESATHEAGHVIAALVFGWPPPLQVVVRADGSGAAQWDDAAIRPDADAEPHAWCIHAAEDVVVTLAGLAAEVVAAGAVRDVSSLFNAGHGDLTRAWRVVSALAGEIGADAHALMRGLAGEAICLMQEPPALQAVLVLAAELERARCLSGVALVRALAEVQIELNRMPVRNPTPAPTKDPDG